MMKKFYLIAALALATLTAGAQQRLYLSTYDGTDLTRYDGETCNVTVNRYVFKGWNTLALPFEMSQQELNEVFGNDCRLERLIGAEDVAGSIQLNFQDCKTDGLQANVPYILYYTGENGNKKIAKQALVSKGEATVSYTTAGGEVITMSGTASHVDGKGYYGVMAIDNSDAKFVSVGENTNGFYATRCFIQLGSGNMQKLSTRHLAKGEVTSIRAIAGEGESVDVYNAAGAKVASQISAAEVSSLKPGVYVVKGQKILVR